MIISYEINGYKVYNNNVKISFEANEKIKNKESVYSYKNYNILKSAIIYGPNNTGKSAFINSIKTLKAIILDGRITDKNIDFFDFNFFNQKKEIYFFIKFLYKEKTYEYHLAFNYQKEIFKETIYIDNKLLFDRFSISKIKAINTINDLFKDYKDMPMISYLPGDNKSISDNIKLFFKSITIINSDFNDFIEVINGVSNLKPKEFVKFNSVLKQADISIQNIKLNEIKDNEDNLLKLSSEYIMNNKKISIPSFISDSDGTKVFMLYILKIIEAIRNGGIIIIDEIDKSLHTLLTKSVISIFNNSNNHNLQLLASSQDLLLLDCLFLFRKDQIWFTYKDNEAICLYSLNDYKANKDKQIRNKTMESYLQGLFGSLPHPDIEDSVFYDE